MTDQPTALAGAKAAFPYPAPDLPSAEIALDLWTQILALKADNQQKKKGVPLTSTLLQSHLHNCAVTLDQAFYLLICEALKTPEPSRRSLTTALYAQKLFRQIFEQLKASEHKKAAKRNDKKRKLVHRW